MGGCSSHRPCWLHTPAPSGENHGQSTKPAHAAVKGTLCPAHHPTIQRMRRGSSEVASLRLFGCSKVFLKRLLGGLSFKSYMAAVGKWGGRIGYVGNLLGCPYIQCNPPFVHSSNKAWSVPRLLRHSGSGLGGIRGVRGAQCAAHGKRQRGGGALRYHGLMHLFPFQHWSMAGPLVASMPPVLSFGVQGHTGTPAFPSPLVTRGQILKSR